MDFQYFLCTIRLLSIRSTCFKVRWIFLNEKKSKIHLDRFSFSFFLRVPESSPNTIIPQVLYTDYTTLDNDNRTDDDEDDPLIDYATNQMLDGRFDDITSSTKVI